jgi:hypothetical protein
MKNKAFAILLNLCERHASNQGRRIKDAIAFIEASRLNSMTNEDIHAFLDHFKDREQSKVIMHIMQFEESYKYLTEKTLLGYVEDKEL